MTTQTTKTTTTKKKAPMYTKAQVTAMINQVTTQLMEEHQKQMDQVVTHTEDAIDKVTAAPEVVQAVLVSEGEQTVNKVTMEQKEAAIKACKEEMERLDKLMDRYVVFNEEKYYAAMDEYRKVEERLTKLKGKSVTALINEKYKGVSRTAAQKLYGVAEVTEKYGHSGVDKGTNLLNTVFTSLVDVTKEVVNVADKTGHAAINITGEVAHAGVNLTAGTMRATADIINKRK